MGSVIYFSKKWAEFPDAEWISFWTDKETVDSKAEECQSCMKNIYSQIVKRQDIVQLGPASSCYKTISILPDEKICRNVVDIYGQTFVRLMHGKYGGKTGLPTKIALVYTPESQKHGIAKELIACSSNFITQPHVFFSRGCEIFEKIFGTSANWKKAQRIMHPENTPEIIDYIEKTLPKGILF